MPNLCLSVSRKSSIDKTSFLSSSAFFFLLLSTYPGGKACRYLHLSPPLGHSQNHPYLPSSMASRKNLHTMSVVVCGFPCFDLTTFSNLDWSHLSMVSTLFKNCKKACRDAHLLSSRLLHLCTDLAWHPDNQYHEIRLHEAAYLAVDIEVMRKFTFVALCTSSCFEKGAQHCLWISSKRYFLLNLDRLEKVGELFFGLELLCLFVSKCLLLIGSSFLRKDQSTYTRLPIHKHFSVVAIESPPAVLVVCVAGLLMTCFSRICEPTCHTLFVLHLRSLDQKSCLQPFFACPWVPWPV